MMLIYSLMRRVCLYVLISTLFNSVWCTDAAEIKKCLDIPEVHPKKYVHYDDAFQNITLETSSRVTHQLATHIFEIFLKEVLGYADVEVIKHEDNFQVEGVITRLSDFARGGTIKTPFAMINVEVWVTPEVDMMPLIDTHSVNEGGTLGPPGRFGWFIPRKLMSPIKSFFRMKTNDPLLDVHWTLFKDQSFVSLFDITDPKLLEYLRNNSYVNSETKRFHCANTTVCKDGMFVPPQCRSTSSNCAYLLASDFNDTNFMIDDIKEQKLYVKIVWLGPNLKRVALHLSQSMQSQGKSLIVFHYTPSDLIFNETEYVSVVFTHCNLLRSYSKVGCKDELTRLAKFSWSKLSDIAEPAYNALHKFKFDQEQLVRLLQWYNDFSENSTVEDIACMWMRNNTPWWTSMKPIEKKPILYIGGIFPFHASSYNGKGIVKAAVMAKEAINSNNTILPDYELSLMVVDGQCQADRVMKAFIDYIVEHYYSRLVGVLGPACSDTVEPLAGVSKLYGTVVISYSAEGSSFSDRERYPYFFRTIGENKQYKHVYLNLFKRYGWKRWAALTEDGQKYTEYISHMQTLLEENNIQLISNTKFPRERQVSEMTRYLEDLKRKRARIIIADVYDEVARTVMCEAYKLGMTARDGYIWFLPKWLNSTFYDTDFYNKESNEHINCTTAEMKRTIEGYFTMTHAFFAPDDAIMQENKTVKEWRQNYENITRESQPRVEVSNYGGYAYDAVWVYALALDRLIRDSPRAVSDLHSSNVTNKLVQLITETDFHGVSGHIKFRGGPSRTSIINIMQWYDGDLHNIGQFDPKLNDNSPDVIGGTLSLNDSLIRWFSAKKPPDDGSQELSPCPLKDFADFLHVDCEMALVMLNLFIAVPVLLMLAIAVIMIKKRYDKKVQATHDYMKSLGLDIDLRKVELEKWEIPRESVVINRKLGEGAFGMVYGGEANFPNQGWLAVAVKTLKCGANEDEKVDFLSEAHVMKQFDHKNIIKLLGVCTKNEPVYTVMEFMLYGDLKTYLLARRHLVNDKSEESEEISSKKLTAMALDVARALSYLSDLEYVHRDIASRNCLINAQRTVKLADFGMTRSVAGNDYYRFVRKGMLPIRWMAPESLEHGRFTIASDMWSYGVLLYEIITFGSFPFQTMNNCQVMEYIKTGHTLEVPQGVKPQLEFFLKNCWRQDPEKRPTAKETVEFLANNPRLLHPCLEEPASAVQLEESGQLEIHLNDQLRKRSSASFKSLQTPLPNGTAGRKTQHTEVPVSPTRRQQSVPDGGVCLQMDSHCLREPLLGPMRTSSSLLGLSKFVGIQAKNGDDNQDDGYCTNSSANGHAITKV